MVDGMKAQLALDGTVTTIAGSTDPDYACKQALEHL